MLDRNGDAMFADFNINDAKTKGEKLVVELLELFRETTLAFVNLNRANTNMVEIYQVLLNASIAHTYIIIRSCSNCIKDKQSLVNEVKHMFDLYMQKILEETDRKECNIPESIL